MWISDSGVTTTVVLVCNSMEALRIDLTGLTLLKYRFLNGGNHNINDLIS